MRIQTYTVMYCENESDHFLNRKYKNMGEYTSLAYAINKLKELHGENLGNPEIIDDGRNIDFSNTLSYLIVNMSLTDMLTQEIQKILGSTKET